MDKQTTFQVNVSQRRHRLANVRVTVSPTCTEVDGVAWGNQNAVPLALGLLLYAAHAFSVEGQIRAAIELAIQEYDPNAEFGGKPNRQFSVRQTPLIEDDDIPF